MDLWQHRRRRDAWSRFFQFGFFQSWSMRQSPVRDSDLADWSESLLCYAHARTTLGACKYFDEHGQATLATDVPDVTKFNHNLNLLARWGDSPDSTVLSHQQSISVLSALPNGTQPPAAK